MAARITIKAVNDELPRLGYDARLEKDKVPGFLLCRKPSD
jgi:hypothetical protein